jgi:hypothetical protein
MSQPVRSSALNFSSPWLVETPESFVILDAADAWVFLSPAAPIFIWGICTHRWLLLHSCNMCYMPCSRRNNNSPGTRSKPVASTFAFLERKCRFSLIYATKLLLIKTGFFRDTNSLHLDALDDWTRQRLPVFNSDVLANKESASTRSAISVPQECGLIRTEFSVGFGPYNGLANRG